jgi:hypothetical protein
VPWKLQRVHDISNGSTDGVTNPHADGAHSSTKRVTVGRSNNDTQCHTNGSSDSQPHSWSDSSTHCRTHCRTQRSAVFFPNAYAHVCTHCNPYSSAHITTNDVTYVCTHDRAHRRSHCIAVGIANGSAVFFAYGDAHVRTHCGSYGSADTVANAANGSSIGSSNDGTHMHWVLWSWWCLVFWYQRICRQPRMLAAIREDLLPAIVWRVHKLTDHIAHHKPNRVAKHIPNIVTNH